MPQVLYAIYVHAYKIKSRTKVKPFGLDVEVSIGEKSDGEKRCTFSQLHDMLRKAAKMPRAMYIGVELIYRHR